MSHLICPLCGLNVPLSKLDEGNFPIDLKTISFKNRGYRMGFGVDEIVSIMGDGEITPIIATRIKELYDFFVEHGEIDAPLVDPNYGSILIQLNNLKRQLSGEKTNNLFLKNRINEVEDDYELDRQVDYIIRESLCVGNARQQLTVDENGWTLAISSKPGQLEMYLFLLILDIPSKLKVRLLTHIKGDENPIFYNNMLKYFSRRQSIAERLLDYDNENTVVEVDETGKKIEHIFKPVYRPEYAGRSIGFEQLKRIVESAKEHSDEPEYIGKTIIDVKYPKKLVLPYRGEG